MAWFSVLIQWFIAKRIVSNTGESGLFIQPVNGTAVIPNSVLENSLSRISYVYRGTLFIIRLHVLLSFMVALNNNVAFSTLVIFWYSWSKSDSFIFKCPVCLIIVWHLQAGFPAILCQKPSSSSLKHKLSVSHPVPLFSPTSFPDKHNPFPYVYLMLYEVRFFWG